MQRANKKPIITTNDNALAGLVQDRNTIIKLAAVEKSFIKISKLLAEDASEKNIILRVRAYIKKYQGQAVNYLSTKTLVNDSIKLSLPLLSWAVIKSQVSLARILLQAGVSPDSLSHCQKDSNENQCSALMFACRKGDTKLVKLLLRYNAKLELINLSEENLQIMASSPEITILLFKKLGLPYADVDKKINLQHLMKLKKNKPYTPAEIDFSELHLLIFQKEKEQKILDWVTDFIARYKEEAVILISNSAISTVINSTTEIQMPVLSFAVVSSYYSLLRALLDYGIAANKASHCPSNDLYNDCMPLKLAEIMNDKEIVALLMGYANGSYVATSNKFQENLTERKELLKQGFIEIVDLLQQNKTEREICNKISQYIAKYHQEAVNFISSLSKLTLEYKNDSLMNVPLISMAVIKSHNRIFKMLISYGISVDTVSTCKSHRWYDQCSPLFFASLQGNLKAVKTLLENNAVIAQANTADQTAISQATSFKIWNELIKKSSKTTYEQSFKINETYIPKMIHMIWVGGRIPKKYLENIRQVNEIARKSKFQLILWVDHPSNFQENAYLQLQQDLLSTNTPSGVNGIKINNIHELQKEMKLSKFYGDKMNDLCSMIDREMIGHHNYAAAADILRYIILEIYGGCYFDMDTSFLPSKNSRFKSAIPRLGVLLNTRVSTDGRSYCGNDIIAALPNHSLMQLAIVNAVQHYKKYDKEMIAQEYDTRLMDIKRLPFGRVMNGYTQFESRRSLTLYSTGPGLLFDSLKEFFLLKNASREVAEKLFLKVSFIEKKQVKLSREFSVMNVTVESRSDQNWLSRSSIQCFDEASLFNKKHRLLLFSSDKEVYEATKESHSNVFSATDL